MHGTKISTEFEFGVTAPWVRTHKNVALGYDVGKISAGCLNVQMSTVKYCQDTLSIICALVLLN